MYRREKVHVFAPAIVMYRESGATKRFSIANTPRKLEILRKMHFFENKNNSFCGEN